MTTKLLMYQGTIYSILTIRFEVTIYYYFKNLNLLLCIYETSSIFALIFSFIQKFNTFHFPFYRLPKRTHGHIPKVLDDDAIGGIHNKPSKFNQVFRIKRPNEK